MVKNVLTNALYFLVGIGVGYLVFTLRKCEPIQDKPIVVTKTDTIVNVVKVKVPKYKEIYVSRTDTLYSTVFDSIEKWSYITIPDSSTIQLNQYIDSVKTEDYRFDYQIMTLGDLIRFDPKFTIYQKTKNVTTKTYPKWMVSGALSTRGHFKVGVGYKGWTIETELSDGFEQIYFGKQYNF